MSDLVSAIARQGHQLIFLNVLLQQIGVPLPAEPTLLVAGSLAAHGRLSLPGIAGAALVATLVADLAWFLVGKRYGDRALRFVFSWSASPGRHLQQTERRFARWGPAAFAIAKFVPGLPMVGPILAGSLGATLLAFLVYDLLAMGLWAGAFTTLGMIFQRDVELALARLDRLGGWGLLLAAAAVVALLGRRWYRSRGYAKGGPL